MVAKDVMRRFVIQELRQCPDLSTISQATVRARYMKFLRLGSVSKAEALQLKRIVEEELLKMQDSDSDNEPLVNKLVSKAKRKRGEDEEEEDLEEEKIVAALKKSRFDQDSPDSGIDRPEKEKSQDMEEEKKINKPSTKSLKKMVSKGSKKRPAWSGSDDSAGELMERSERQNIFREDSSSSAEDKREKKHQKLGKINSTSESDSVKKKANEVTNKSANEEEHKDSEEDEEKEKNKRPSNKKAERKGNASREHKRRTTESESDDSAAEHNKKSAKQKVPTDDEEDNSEGQTVKGKSRSKQAKTVACSDGKRKMTQKIAPSLSLQRTSSDTDSEDESKSKKKTVALSKRNGLPKKDTSKEKQPTGKGTQANSALVSSGSEGEAGSTTLLERERESSPSSENEGEVEERESKQKSSYSESSEAEDETEAHKVKSKEDSDSSSLPSLDEDDKRRKSKPQKTKMKKRKVPKEDETSNGKREDKSVSRLKHYIALCGVRKNYKKLLEGCRSVKSQVSVLKRELQELGVEGQPSIEKCKRVRLKREQAQELADLDMRNIITSVGRPQRRTSSLWSLSPSAPPISSQYKHALDSDSGSDRENGGQSTRRRITDWSNMRGIISDDAESD